ncbi:CBS domain-containing protein [Ureibacillus thermophilus]|uniref:CBS domain-containing protein n=1 Tax=Ureibacillus thermophilus TaxID=367743 RepID=A0A4P6UNZ1_9BACL|nr:CBS domain-containing protein [Ureibacillus thermophilus]QBK24723.1 CBS domain-containing protein [Ureibacillus thermophilus]
MKNSERFLSAFNRITFTLRKIIKVKEHMPFYRLVDLAKKKSPLVKKYEDDLRSFADLRNAIVHYRVSENFIIAEPHIQVVERIEYIDQLLARPSLVGQVFRKNVVTFQTNDSLKEVLDIIQERKYTQFPVYEGRDFQGLITTVGITNWLADIANHKILVYEMPTLRDILNYEKKRVNYRFISRYLTVYHAKEIYKESVERGKRYDALLITEHGKPHQKLIGIITPLDLMKVH